MVHCGTVRKLRGERRREKDVVCVSDAVMPEEFTPRLSCVLCGLEEARRCSKCGAVAYCGQQCQR